MGPTHHRLRLSISSSNHPRFEANPNTGVPLSMEDGTTIIAQNTVYHDATYPSNIRLPIVQLKDLPKHNILQSTEKMLKKYQHDANDGIVATKMLNDLMLDIQES